MKQTAQYLEIGNMTYKIKNKSQGVYSVWHCLDICSLRYLGERTIQQLIKSCECGALQ